MVRWVRFAAVMFAGVFPLRQAAEDGDASMLLQYPRSFSQKQLPMKEDEPEAPKKEKPTCNGTKDVNQEASQPEVLVQTQGAAAPRLDPLDVSKAEISEKQYAKDWVHEWKQDPNAKQRNTKSTSTPPGWSSMTLTKKTTVGPPAKSGTRRSAGTVGVASLAAVALTRFTCAFS
mmetsp:Transcript_69812/g.138140  ORF Transcript_69812/g.138140 Transcript_69812/m.138140 type:complete len:174 (+) Transcript_69812:51-572(+)